MVNKKIKIAINALSVTIGGGVTFFQNIVANLPAQDKNNQYYLFAAEDNFDAIFTIIDIPSNVIVIKIRRHNLFLRLIQEQILIPYLVWKNEINILICSANIASFFAPCKKMLWILNIYPYFNLNIEGESLFEKLRFKSLKLLSSLSMKFSELSVFISDFSRESTLKTVKIHPDKAITIYLGASTDAFQVKETDDLSRDFDYILSVSSISKRKNYEILMEAYNELNPSVRGRYKIILVGDVTDALKSHLLGFIKNQALRERIIFKGEISLEELCLTYKKASLFVLPSLVEAFGLPVIEAMAAGVPVLIANATSLPEIAGKAGLRFDPYDPIDLARKIEKVLLDNNLSSEMSQHGIEHARSFTWTNTAKEILKCYPKILENNK